MSRRLIELGLIPTMVLTSSARRAQQTADIVARELGVAPRNLRIEESLYLAPAEDILRVVQTTGPRIPHLMIVGHNPGITDVAKLLAQTPRIEDLATAAVFSLTFESRTWADVEAGNLRDSRSVSPPVGLFTLWA